MERSNGNGPGSPAASGSGHDETPSAACANTDREIWRDGQPILDRADIDALIEAAVFLRTYAANKGPIPLDATIEKLQAIRAGDYYKDRIFITERGGIGIDVGGLVFIKPLREWHAMAKGNPDFDWQALQRLRKSSDEGFKVCPYCLDRFTADTYALHRCSKRPPEAPK